MRARSSHLKRERQMVHFRRLVEDRAGPLLLLGRLMLAWLFVH